MFAPWQSQKSLRKHKDPITGISFIIIAGLTPLYHIGYREARLFHRVRSCEKIKNENQRGSGMLKKLKQFMTVQR